MSRRLAINTTGISARHRYLAMWKDLKLPDGRDRVVRHGHGPHRAIQTGVGPVEVRRAKVRDRGEVGAADEESRCAVASSLPAWGVGRRLPGGARRPLGQRRAEPAQSRMAFAFGRARALAKGIAAHSPSARAGPRDAGKHTAGRCKLFRVWRGGSIRPWKSATPLCRVYNIKRFIFLRKIAVA
jgi:hypothetical protein